MGTFIFLLIFFFVLLPLGRVAWAVWRQYRIVRRHMREAEKFRETFERGSGASRSDGPHPRQPRRRDKKISRDVGEYVAFEEMRVYDSGDRMRERPQVPPEPQIEDADWEEIKS